jgi:putative ABC transport system permease protein
VDLTVARSRMPYLALKNLRFRKVRTAISILAVGVGIMTLVVLRGLTEGTIGEVAQRMQSVKADLLVWDQGHNTMMLQHTMSAKYAEKIAPLPDVTRVVPVLNDSVSLAGQAQTIYAVPPADFDIFGGEASLVKGRLFAPGAKELVVDTVLARLVKGGLRVGDTVEHRGENYTICGIIREGVVGRVFMPYDTASQLWYNNEQRANMLMVKVARPEAVERVTRDIKALGLIVVDKGNYYSVIAGDTKLLYVFTLSTTLVTLFVSFLTILLTMFTIVQEQTREVGILKALGAERRYIMQMVLAQSLLICVSGVLVGFALSVGAKQAISLAFPLMTVSLHWTILGTALGVGLVGGLLGALYPAWRASKLDPVATLSYE